MTTLLEIEAVTEPICAVPATRAGREAIVRELPTVTDEMDMGTVPLMLAVTLPICAVPASMATVPFTDGRDAISASTCKEPSAVNGIG